jgi:hypothetical protein
MGRDIDESIIQEAIIGVGIALLFSGSGSGFGPGIEKEG